MDLEGNNAEHSCIILHNVARHVDGGRCLFFHEKEENRKAMGFT